MIIKSIESISKYFIKAHKITKEAQNIATIFRLRPDTRTIIDLIIRNGFNCVKKELSLRIEVSH